MFVDASTSFAVVVDALSSSLVSMYVCLLLNTVDDRIEH